MAQRVPLTQAEKERIVEKKAAGLNLRQISEILQCSFETVRKWWRFERDQRPERARGRPKGGPLSTYPQVVREKAIELKNTHPHWGPKMIRLKMERELSLEKSQLPSAARLSVLFKQACLDKVQPRQLRLPPPPTQAVTSVHQRWQMDAKEGLPVGTERDQCARNPRQVQWLDDCQPGGSDDLAQRPLATSKPGRTSTSVAAGFFAMGSAARSANR